MISAPTSAVLLHESQKDAGTKAESLIRGARGVKQDGELDKIAKEFEAVFLSEMIRPIFESVEVDPMFGGGRSEEIFKGMMIDEYGKSLSEAGGIGLASFVKAELIKLQNHDAQQGQ